MLPIWCCGLFSLDVGLYFASEPLGPSVTGEHSFSRGRVSWLKPSVGDLEEDKQTGTARTDWSIGISIGNSPCT